jgi:hypothetical protein
MQTGVCPGTGSVWNTTKGEAVQKSQTPPASAAWCFNFYLDNAIFSFYARHSRAQDRYGACVRLKLRLHAAETGGVCITDLLGLSSHFAATSFTQRKPT